MHCCDTGVNYETARVSTSGFIITVTKGSVHSPIVLTSSSRMIAHMHTNTVQDKNPSAAGGGEKNLIADSKIK